VPALLIRGCSASVNPEGGRRIPVSSKYNYWLMLDRLEIRMIEGEPALVIPLRLIRRVAAAPPFPEEAPPPSTQDDVRNDVIADTVAVLAEIDPTHEGKRPKDILATLDARGFRYWPERPAKARVRLFASRLWRECYRQAPRLRLRGRARYTAAAGGSAVARGVGFLVSFGITAEAIVISACLL
jgi:hypothetical protein